jgi:hypothetical protein
MAKTYLAAHREALMSEAMATVHQWALDGVFGKKVQCAWRAKLESDAQPQTQQTSMASVAQMSGAK